MKQGAKGQMNIDFSETYDQEDDIYYVTFNTGEPSYCTEVNDMFLLERGMFSNLPTGFRILNFHKNKVKMVGIKVDLIKQAKESIPSQGVPTFHQREATVTAALEKVLSA